MQIANGIVESILNSTQLGKDFLAKIDRASQLKRSAEIELCDLICAYFFTAHQTLTIKQLKAIAEDIEFTFPKELSSTFYSKNEVKHSGILYDKYNNKLKLLRNNQLMPGSSRERKVQEVIDSTSKKVEYSSEELSSNEFVKYTAANIEFSMVENHWRRSSRIRIDTFLVSTFLFFT